MRAISSEFRGVLHDNATLLCKATLTTPDGVEHQLTGDDIVDCKCEQATSSDQSFDIGACVVGKCDITLNNHDGRFEDYDFTDARLAVWVGKALSSSVEWVRVGTYVVDQPDSYSGTIALSCLDYMSRLSRPYSDVTTTYPCRPSQAFRDILQRCQLAYVWQEGIGAVNDTTQLTRSPDTQNMTCLQALGYLAQLMGVWCRCDGSGRVLVSWYDQKAIDAESSDPAWGELEAMWDDEHTDVASWSASFLMRYGYSVHCVMAPYSSTTMTDDVVVTGVRATAANEVVIGEDGRETNGRDGETSTAGSDGYVLDIGQNPFVEYGRANEVATNLYARVGGMRFRPFSLTCPADPSVEAGDPIVYVDRNMALHRSHVTSVTIGVNQAMSVRCSAKSAARNSATRYSAATQAAVKARAELRREMNAREIAQADLADRLANSSGLYSTPETQSDGSVVYYLHDKPTLGASRVIWKMTSDAVAVSSDGGKTYATGVTAAGDAILNRIYAVGIDADHITTGRLSSKDGKSFIDLDTGAVRIGTGSTVDGHAIVTDVDVLYGISDSPTSVPAEWGTTPPAWADGRYIWSKTRTTSGGKTSDTEPVCITGARGETGAKGDDGSSVTIKGTVASRSDLPATADAGDGYIIDGDLWVWGGTSWADVGKVQGPAGRDGKSVTVSSVRYAAGTSGTTAPTSGWQATVPSVPQGGWLWVRLTYSDGTTADSCSHQGTDGEDGTSVAVRSVVKTGSVTTVTLAGTDGSTSTFTISDGKDGENGRDGRDGEDGIPGTSRYVHFAWADADDGAMTAWVEHNEAWGDSDRSFDSTYSGYDGFSTIDSAGKLYLGVCTNDDELDPQNPMDYTWSLVRGSDGNGIKSVTVSYGVSQQQGVRPTSWQNSVPSDVSEGDWLWTRTITDYTEDAVPDTVTYTYSHQGVSGEDGTSVGVRSIMYQASGSATQAPTGTWSSSVVEAGQGKYLWTQTTFTDGAVAYGIARQGADGNGISSVTVSYGTSSGPTERPARWQVAVPSTAEGDWLWVRTITDYTDPSVPDTVTYSYSHQGTSGVDGTSVSVRSIRYQAGASATQAPTGTWSSSVVEVSPGRYLWTRTEMSDGTVAYGVARQGQDGKSPTATVSKSGTTTTITVRNTDGTTTTAKVEDGENGTKGANGYVHVKYSNDGGRTLTANYGETPGSYLGQYTDNTEADSTDPTRYSWYQIKGSTGDTGKGVSAVREEYYLSTGTSILSGGSWSTAQPAWSTGRYVWTRSRITWTDGTTTYTEPVLAKAINGANENAQTAVSKIEKLPDLINLSVTGGLGSTASIKLTVDGQTKSQSLGLDKVRQAFANDNSAVSISAGTITFRSNTFVVDSTYFKVRQNGTITATAGTIGGFTISSNTLSNGGLRLRSDGTHFINTVNGTAYDVGHIGVEQNGQRHGIRLWFDATGGINTGSWIHLGYRCNNSNGSTTDWSAITITYNSTVADHDPEIILRGTLDLRACAVLDSFIYRCEVMESFIVGNDTTVTVANDVTLKIYSDMYMNNYSIRSSKLVGCSVPSSETLTVNGTLRIPNGATLNIGGNTNVWKDIDFHGYAVYNAVIKNCRSENSW